MLELSWNYAVEADLVLLSRFKNYLLQPINSIFDFINMVKNGQLHPIAIAIAIAAGHYLNIVLLNSS